MMQCCSFFAFAAASRHAPGAADRSDPARSLRSLEPLNPQSRAAEPSMHQNLSGPCSGGPGPSNPEWGFCRARRRRPGCDRYRPASTSGLAPRRNSVLWGTHRHMFADRCGNRGGAFFAALLCARCDDFGSQLVHTRELRSTDISPTPPSLPE